MKTILIVLLSLVGTGVYGNPKETLIGGEPVKVGEYPEVVRIRSCDGGRCAGCSATIVGPLVVLTAGHCLKGDGNISFMFEQNEYKGTCESHELYPHTEDMDMALCKLERKVEVKYAHVLKSGPQVGDVVTLLGYGCTTPPGTGGNDGILRVGEAPVTKLPTASPINNWFYTKNETAACYGDSGGPSFRRVTNPKEEIHYVYGQISRGNIRDLSLMTASYLPKGVSWMEKWEKANKVAICGLSGKCGKQSPEPKPESRRCRRYKRKIERYESKVDKWKQRYQDKCVNL